jgi:glycerate kinase
VAFLGARLERGVALMADACGLDAAIHGADLVITAEGRFDGQSLNGKTPIGVASIAQRHGVPCVVLAGSLGNGYEGGYELGVTAAFSISAGPGSLVDAMRDAHEHLVSTSSAVMRAWNRAAGSAR